MFAKIVSFVEKCKSFKSQLIMRPRFIRVLTMVWACATEWGA